jgi:hypothetical protein
MVKAQNPMGQRTWRALLPQVKSLRQLVDGWGVASKNAFILCTAISHYPLAQKAFVKSKFKKTLSIPPEWIRTTSTENAGISTRITNTEKCDNFLQNML